MFSSFSLRLCTNNPILFLSFHLEYLKQTTLVFFLEIFWFQKKQESLTQWITYSEKIKLPIEPKLKEKLLTLQTVP